MNIALWICQGLLALVFLAAATIKIVAGKAKMIEKLGDWAGDFEVSMLRLIGVAELLGAVGIVLPTLLGIAPVLTAAAALGLLLIMAGAMVTHAKRREYPNLIVNLILAGMCAFVAYGRL